MCVIQALAITHLYCYVKYIACIEFLHNVMTCHCCSCMEGGEADAACRGGQADQVCIQGHDSGVYW